MSSHHFPFYIFTIASTILIVFSIMAMIVHSYLDGYSIRYDRLSYSGVRQDFIHPIRGSRHSASSYPQILNLSLTIPAVLYIIGFVLIGNIVIKILGILFALTVFIVGAIDVSSSYHIHNGAVIISQPLFLTLVISIMVINYNLLTLLVFIAVLVLVLINIYQKQIKNRNPNLRTTVLPQKLFIYIEAIYLIIFPHIVH